MFSQYFGQYLLNRNIVNADQLKSAMDTQQHTRVKLGVLAINQGYMTPKQVEEVHQLQMKVDKRFGEIAVEKGYISEPQVEELLSSQKSDHLVLGQTLIDNEVLSYESFSAALQQYKQDYSLSDEQFSLILRGDIESLITGILFKNRNDQQEWLSDYVTLFAKNLVRFIDGHIRLELLDIQPNETYDWIFTQELNREGTSSVALTAIAGSESSLVRLASRYAQEDLVTADEYMQSSVGEFLNLHNGIYLVNVSNRGVELDMKPQQALQHTLPRSETPMSVIRVYGTDTQFDVWVSDLSHLLQ